MEQRLIDKDKLVESMVWRDDQGMILSIDDVLDIIDTAPAIDPESLLFTVGKRADYLEELYMKMQAVTGLTPERLLELFMEGYTLQAPDYRKNFEEMQRMAHMDWEMEDKSDGKID